MLLFVLSVSLCVYDCAHKYTRLTEHLSFLVSQLAVETTLSFHSVRILVIVYADSVHISKFLAAFKYHSGIKISVIF